MSETAAASLLGPKVVAGLLVLLAVFSITAYSVTQVSASNYIVTIEVKDNSPFAATVQNVTLQAWDFTSGSLLFYAHATDLPLTVQPGQSANVTLFVYTNPAAYSLPDSEQVHVVGFVSYSVGFMHPSICLDSVYTVGQIKAVVEGQHGL